MIKDKAKESITSFVLSLEKPGGGFSFSTTTPATIEDTYYALNLLKNSETNQRTRDYIQTLKPKKHMPLRQLYRLTHIYKSTGLIQEHKEEILKILSRGLTRPHTIQDIYYEILIR